MSHPAAVELEALAYAALEPGRAAQVEAHLADCASCVHTLRLEREERRILTRAFQSTWRQGSLPPLEAVSWPPRRDSFTRVLAGTAAGLIVAAALWLGLRDGSPAGQVRKPTPFEWGFPVEVDKSVPYGLLLLRSAVVTPEGRMSILSGQTLYTKPSDQEAWGKSVTLVPGTPMGFGINSQVSDLIADGETVGVLAWTQDDGRLRYLSTTPGKGMAEIMLDPPPGAPLNRVSSLDLLCVNGVFFALAEVTEHDGGRVYVSRSQDRGRTWSAWRKVVGDALPSGQHGLLLYSGDLQFYFLGYNGGLFRARSGDQGVTWARNEVPAAHRILEFVRCASTSNAIHLAYATLEGKQELLCHLSSVDGGRTWSATKILSGPFSVRFDQRGSFQLRGSGTTLLLSRAGSPPPERALILISRDEGATWQVEDRAFAGLGGVPTSSVAWCMGDGRILLGLDIRLSETDAYLLAREYGPTGKKREGLEAPRSRWWK